MRYDYVKSMKEESKCCFLTFLSCGQTELRDSIDHNPRKHYEMFANVQLANVTF